MNASSHYDAESLEKHFNRIAGLLMNRIVLIADKNDTSTNDTLLNIIDKLRSAIY